MTKKVIKLLIIFIILLFTYFILFKIIRIQDKMLMQIYPVKYDEYVTKYA